MNTSTDDERFRELTDPVRPTWRTRVLRWLWYRDIDPDALIGWTLFLLVIVGFWGPLIWWIVR